MTAQVFCIFHAHFVGAILPLSLKTIDHTTPYQCAKFVLSSHFGLDL